MGIGHPKSLLPEKNKDKDTAKWKKGFYLAGGFILRSDNVAISREYAIRLVLIHLRANVCILINFRHNFLG
jgi:hypothetical protein